ncbi:MAG: hypothetical protein IT370_28540 [Deltaproteobacteria bacterium]|nr:hypothetical protein [Deltaproteobacteria bacterium]
MHRAALLLLPLLASCGTRNPAPAQPHASPAPSVGPAATPLGSPTPADDATRPSSPWHAQIPVTRPLQHHPFRELPPPGGPGATDLPVVAARIFAFGDTQFHHMFGKRTWAQSPFADRQSVEVAVRPAALDDGSDLLLEAFLAVQRDRYPRHTRVYMGDAADASCTQEYATFFATLARFGLTQLIMTTSNHDGFFMGNYTSNGDLDGKLGYAADMPADWTRACAEPGSREDHRLTRGRALTRVLAALPAAPAWATTASLIDVDGPTAYRRAWLTAVRPLGGGDGGAPPAWAALVDTSDYRDRDIKSSRGAGTVGGISRAQLTDIDHAMFEARALGARPWWVVLGHHPLATLDAGSRARVIKFLEVHPEIVAWVSAHTHKSAEAEFRLPSGRVIPELIVGSTTDAPQEGRIIELRVAADGSRAGIASWRLALATDELCEGIAALDPDSLGYLGYRLVRDDTPDVSLGWLRKIGLYFGFDDLGQERIAQTLGALLVESDLVRALAHLYDVSPIPRSDAEQAALAALLARRFPHADSVRELRQVIARPASGPYSDYEAWTDPMLRTVVPPVTREVWSFAATRPLFEALRGRRRASPETQRWFACHAARAGAAEALRPRRQGDIVYIP